MRTIQQLSIKGLFLPAIALCSLLVVAETSRAAPVPVTFSFTGSVSGVTGLQLPSLIPPGLNNMSGDVTYDSAAPQVFPGTGFYPDSIMGLTLNINLNSGSYQALYASGSNGIFIINSPAGGGDDNITAFSSATSASSIAGTLPVSFYVSLSDPTGNVFSNLDLPTTPPSVGSFASTSNAWGLVFANGDKVVGSFNTLTSVPLPAAVILFGAGLIALVGLGAGGLRYLR